MKRLLYFLSAIVFSLSTHAAEGDSLRATLKVSDDLNTAKLSVSLANTASYVAFQMDIILPEGWSVEAEAPVLSKRLKDDDTVFIDEDEQSTNFVLAHNVLEGNRVRIIAYNFGNHAIRLESGEIFSIRLTKTAGEAVTVSDWKATFSEVLFYTEQDKKNIQIYLNNKAASQTVAGSGMPKIGDINQDGIISGNDLLSILDIIGNDYTRETYTGDVYDLDAADLNDDGVWNGNDLIALLSLL